MRVVLAGAAAVVLAAVLLAPMEGRQGTVPGMAMVLSATVGGIAVLVWSVRRFRRALLDELAAGYVTTTFHQGMFWFSDRPGPKVGNDVAGGSGTDCGCSTRAATSCPRLTPREPPGMHPSPSKPGTLELWTGSQWLGVHRAIDDGHWMREQ